jgi:ribonuclease D
VAELVDALASGASDRKVVEVRVLSWAPNPFDALAPSGRLGHIWLRLDAERDGRVTNHLYKNDLPDGLYLGPIVAIDCETMGLIPQRDRLCVVQLSSGDGDAHLVQIDKGQTDAPNLARLLRDPEVLKLFHFGRFDIAVMYHAFGALASPVYCTKIASRLVRTYTDRHGLKYLLQELLDIDISKQQQSSDWGAVSLSEAQKSYAASDVLYLHRLKAKLDVMLEREGRTGLAQACFDFLPARAQLDLAGWPEIDIFAH